MKVFVIAEDWRLDQYILKPVLQRLFDELRPNTKIDFCREPRVGGVSQATNHEILTEVFGNYPQANLFLLILDRDCDSGREDALERCIAHANESGKIMLGCVAIEEIEVWALALHRDSFSEPWKNVRGDCDPKDAYFEPLAQRNGWLSSPGKGRKAAMKNLSGRWRGLKQRCDELQSLQDRLRTKLDGM
ncbi:MAG: hypothetical protein NTW96_22350 [Planctomycetia bacterium]|nr:hypothetical protein [Planctomycetia bacterium]